MTGCDYSASEMKLYYAVSIFSWRNEIFQLVAQPARRKYRKPAYLAFV
jgi:hypothetical protein